MTLLISNDDGVHADGIKVLFETLSKAFDAQVVAPSRDQSGASSALTLKRPLSLTRLNDGFFSVDGTPADSVILGLSLCEPKGEGSVFERVVSGVNSHANLGDDVLYSGTVAAAFEGRSLVYPAIAVSLVNRGCYHYETASKVVLDLLLNTQKLAVPSGVVLNVNVPDIAYDKLKGIKVTCLGGRSAGEPPVKVTDPRGRTRYWVGAAGKGVDSTLGTDFHAVENDYVSITPLQVDMTKYNLIDELQKNIRGITE